MDAKHGPLMGGESVGMATVTAQSPAGLNGPTVFCSETATRRPCVLRSGSVVSTSWISACTVRAQLFSSSQ